MEKENRITDKAFSRFIISSVAVILICIAGLSSATWALFSADISSRSNTLTSGNFALTVTVTDSNGSSVTVYELSNGTSVCTLAEADLYSVVLKMTDDTTVSKGFCTIRSDDIVYQSGSINNEGTDPFVFTVDAACDSLTLTFSSEWGLPANPDVEYDGTLRIGDVQ